MLKTPFIKRTWRRHEHEQKNTGKTNYEQNVKQEEETAQNFKKKHSSQETGNLNKKFISCNYTSMTLDQDCCTDAWIRHFKTPFSKDGSLLSLLVVLHLFCTTAQPLVSVSVLTDPTPALLCKAICTVSSTTAVLHFCILPFSSATPLLSSGFAPAILHDCTHPDSSLPPL